MRRLLSAFVLTALLPHSVMAAEQRGSVRAADQPVPGATVTAQQGGAKIVVYTDENGLYRLNLDPGTWDIRIEMLGFTTVQDKVTVGPDAVVKNWTLDMPRAGQPAIAAPSAEPSPGNSARPGLRRRPDQAGGQPAAEGQAGQRQGPRPGGFQGRPGGFPGRPGFQNAPATATPGAGPAQPTQQTPQPDDLALAAGQASAGFDVSPDQAEEAFVVSGSTSGGLAASSDDEARRQQFIARLPPGAGGPGGPGGPTGGLGGPAGLGGLGLPPGMTGPGGDALGLGGFGAAAIDAGFGAGPPGGPGGGPGGFGGGPGGPGGFGGGPGGPGGAGGGGRGGGRGGPAARGGAQGGRGPRGPFNGQFATFGNRRRTQPAYNGSVFLNLENSALDAAPFSLNGQSSAKPSSAHTQFGFNVGGPMVIPKLLNWQRASFYITYQGSINRNQFNGVGSVPTPDERTGNFSGIKSILYDPLNGQPFPSNIIPAYRLNSAALGLLNYFPLPTYYGVVQNYQLIGSVPNDSHNVGVRLNAPLSRKDRLNFNIQYQTRSSETLQLFNYRDSGSGSGINASVGWSHSFAPRFVNSANLTFSRNSNTNTPFFAYSSNVAAALGIAGTSQSPINYGPPNLSFTNFGSLTDGSASLTHNQTVNFTDTLTYILKKKHNLTFGFLYRRLQQNSLTYQNARGSFGFSGLLTSAIGLDGQPASGTGFDFADFLLGLPQSSSLRYGSDNNYFRSWATSAWVQDDFRVSRGLSLNMGLRYEYFAPYSELRGHLSNLDLAPGFTSVAVVTAGQAGPYAGSLPSSLVRPDTGALSPRFGFAWRPTPKRSLLVRGGYSVFYSGSPYAQIANELASQPPFATTASLSTSPANVLTLQNGFSTVPSQSVTNTYAVDPNYRLSYAQTWSLALQSNLPHLLVAEIEYIGTKGTNLAVVEQPNQAPPGSVLTAQQRLLIGNATGFNYLTSGANSSFNAGQIRVTRRFSRGLSANVLYTYSKAIDNASSFTGVGGTVVQYIDNWDAERGPSSTDQRHRLQLNYTLSSPVGVNGLLRNGGWKKVALEGWTLQGAFTASSGTPLTAWVGGNLSNIGGTGALGRSRAQATGLPIDAGSDAYFNLLAFTTPLAGQYGNAGRNTIPGPFRTSLNASLNRSFRFGETRRVLQLRLSANNVVNHVDITSFGTTVNSTTFGLPTAASATRTVTLGMRFNF